MQFLMMACLHRVCCQCEDCLHQLRSCLELAHSAVLCKIAIVAAAFACTSPCEQLPAAALPEALTCVRCQSGSIAPTWFCTFMQGMCTRPCALSRTTSSRARGSLKLRMSRESGMPSSSFRLRWLASCQWLGPPFILWRHRRCLRREFCHCLPMLWEPSQQAPYPLAICHCLEMKRKAAMKKGTANEDQQEVVLASTDCFLCVSAISQH